jgi:hypothetical protein
MAKEIVIKVKVDGQEINVAEQSINQLTNQINGLKQKLADVPLGSAEFKKIQGDITELESGFRKAKDATQPFLESMGQLPGALGYVGRSIEGVKEALVLLEENPIVAILSALAYIVIKVAEELSKMEGVSRALGKASEMLSAVMGALVDKVLTPLAELVVKAIDGFTGLVAKFGEIIGIAPEATDALNKYADAVAEINKNNANLIIQQAEIRAQIAKAREDAQNANLTTQQRVKALKDAAEGEKTLANLQQNNAKANAQNSLQQLATQKLEGEEKQKVYDLIAKGDEASLKSAVKTLSDKSNMDKKALEDAAKNVAEISTIQGDASLRERRLNSTINSLNKADNAKTLEDKKKAIAETEDFEKRLLAFQLDARLQNTKDQQEKDRLALQNDLEKTLKEIDNLKMSTDRKNQLRLAAEKDFQAKAYALSLKQSEENTKKRQEEEKAEREFNDKIAEIQIAAIKDETERKKAERQEKYDKDVAAMYRDTQFLAKSTEQQNEILKNLKTALNNDLDKIDEDHAAKLREQELKRLDEHLKIIQLQQSALIKGTQSFYASQRELLEASQEKELKELDDRAIKEKLKTEDVEKEKAAIKAKYVKQKKDLDKDELNSYLDTASKIAGMANSIIGGLLKVNQEKMDTELQAAGDNQQKQEEIKKKYFEKNKQLQIGQAWIATFQAAIQAYQAMAGIPIVGPILGGIAAAAAIYFGSQQVDAIKAQQYSSSSGSASTSTPTPPVPENLGKNYGSGGTIDGPSHAQGGVPITAEGGEAVMTRGSVTMFGPLLSALNQAGGGKAFSMPVIEGSHNDNPKTNLNQSSSTIIKTYVVSSELTTDQQKQARLKDLSTL